MAVIVGEIANFAAYAFAPAVLVTPLGALSIIIRQEKSGNDCSTFCLLHTRWHIFIYLSVYLCSAALAHMILGEKLHIFGMVGCVLCIVGSTTICLHAPQERQIESVKELWDLATEPGTHLNANKADFFLTYCEHGSFDCLAFY